MRLNSFPHGTEEYYCISCETYKDQFEVKKDWKCPKCKNPVHVRVKTEDKNNACFRINIKELEVNDMILLERNDDFRSVLNLKKEGDGIRVAIEKFGVLTINKDSHILKLDGGWDHNNEKPGGYNI